MSERIIFHLDELANDLSKLWTGPPKGKCIIANGCFDILHPGHLSLLAHLDTIAYLERLRPVVAINSDSSIKLLKGDSRPIVPQQVRASLLISLKWPFTVIIFDEQSPQRLMDLLQPEIVLKGSEYDGKDVIRWKDSRVVTVGMFDGWSTTNIVKENS